MRILINIANVVRGGALQRALSFLSIINERQDGHFYLVILSSDLLEEIDINKFKGNFVFKNAKYSPANILKRRTTLAMLNKLLQEFNADIVFSFVGPAYWRPKNVTHIVGYAVPHIVYNDLPFVKSSSVKLKLEMFYKRLQTKYEADYFVVQTEDVKTRLSRRLGVSRDKIFVVNNNVGIQFANLHRGAQQESEYYNLVTITRYRPSKNLEIIPDVIHYLKRRNLSVRFHVTLDWAIYHKLFKDFTDVVINYGPTFAKDVPKIYEIADALFLPTHLECFSASYVEAMHVGIPILTSNLPFATSVCYDAAVYFDNNNPKEISEKIELIINDSELTKSLIAKGKARLTQFDTTEEQAIKYLGIISNIYSRHKLN